MDVFICHLFVFFFNDTATTEIYTYGHTLSLHDALPICSTTTTSTRELRGVSVSAWTVGSTATYSSIPWRRRASGTRSPRRSGSGSWRRSEEHTSELQSLMRISYAVFCLKKKNHT